MKKVMVIGGANIDLSIKSKHALRKNDSLEASMERSFGGVGRNIVENLARLNIQTSFITALSTQDLGKNLVVHLKRLNVKPYIIEASKTSEYVMIQDENNDLFMGFNDMKSAENVLTFNAITPYHDTIQSSDYILLEGNLSKALIDEIFKRFKNPIIVDGISTTKVMKFLPYLKHIYILKVNTYEANALLSESNESIDEFIKAAKKLIGKGIAHVFITLGDKGAIYANNEEVQFGNVMSREIINTSGAGDSFLSGAIYGLVHQRDMLKCGLSMSALTLKAKEAVNQSLSESLLIKEMEQ